MQKPKRKRTTRVAKQPQDRALLAKMPKISSRVQSRFQRSDIRRSYVDDEFPAIGKGSAAALRRAACKPSMRGDKFRACKAELRFIGPAAAKELGLKPGPHMRICIRKNKPGLLVPVKDPVVARQKWLKFCKCSTSKDAKSCARDIVGQARLGEWEKKGR